MIIQKASEKNRLFVGKLFSKEVAIFFKKIELFLVKGADSSLNVFEFYRGNCYNPGGSNQRLVDFSDSILSEAKFHSFCKFVNIDCNRSFT